MGSFLHHGLCSRKMLSFMCGVAEQNQEIIENLENLTDADLSTEAQSFTGASLHTEFSDLVLHVKNSVHSLCEELRNEIPSKEETGIETFKEVLFRDLDSMESVMKSFSMSCMEKETVELECHKLLDLCLKFSLKFEEIEQNYLIEVCGNVQQILETLCSGVHPDLILETVVELKTAFSVCVKAFHTRFKDLLSPDSYCLMIASMSSLKRTLFILLDSINSIHKAALSHNGFVGKDYILKQLKLSLEMLIIAATSPTPSSQQEDEIGEPGEFVNCIDNILTSIASTESESSLLELQKLVEKAVVHSLSVAQLSLPTLQDRIKKASEAAIAQTKSLTELYESKGKSQKTTSDFRVTVQSCRENLIAEVENLEQQVNQSVMELIVEVLTAPMQSVHDLMDAAVQNSSSKEAANEDKKSHVKKMGDKFHQHIDRIYHVCRFAAACCTDKEMIYALLVTVKNMELLDVEIVPTVLMNPCAELLKEFSYLQLLLSEWYYHVNSLQQILFKITDAPAILKVIDDSIRKEVKTVSHFLYDQEGTEMKKATLNLLKLANCAIQVASAFIQEVQDAPDLNILKEESKNLRKSIRSVNKSYNDVFSNLTDLESHRSLQKHCIILSSCVHELHRVHEDFYNKYGCAYLGKHQETSKPQADKTQDISSGLQDLSLKKGSFICHNTSMAHEINVSSIPVVRETVFKKVLGNSTYDFTSASNINLEITAILDGLKSNTSAYSDIINSSQAKPCLPARKVGKTNPKFLKNSILEVSSTNTTNVDESVSLVPT